MLALQVWLHAEEEPADRAVIAQCVSLLTKLAAKDQAEKDGMLNGKMSPRQLRRV